MGNMERFDFEEVEALRVGRFGKRVNTNCIIYRIEDTVIDTGPANQWRKVRYFLRERDVGRVIMTHHHEDHSGNIARIQKECKVPVHLHDDGHAFVKNGFPQPLYRRIVWGRPQRAEVQPLPARIEAGPLKLQAIHQPGHAPDMVCYLEPNRGWLFSGDAYISSKPRYLRIDEDPNSEIDSLTQLLTLQFDTLLCAHRGVILNGYEAMSNKLKYLVSLREQVGYYMERGDNLKQIRFRLLGKEDLIRWISRGDFSKQNYVDAFARYFRHKRYG